MEVVDLSKNFEEIRPQLRTYIYRMTASVEYIIQHAYIKVQEKLSTFQRY